MSVQCAPTRLPSGQLIQPSWQVGLTDRPLNVSRLYWTSDLANLFAQAGMPRRRPPADTCDGDQARGTAPVITSPLRATTYTQRGGATPQVIALNATADAEVQALHWFANESYVGATKPGSALGWQPPPGAFVLRVVDDHGRSDARDVRVALVE